MLPVAVRHLAAMQGRFRGTLLDTRIKPLAIRGKTHGIAQSYRLRGTQTSGQRPQATGKDRQTDGAAVFDIVFDIEEGENPDASFHCSDQERVPVGRPVQRPSVSNSLFWSPERRNDIDPGGETGRRVAKSGEGDPASVAENTVQCPIRIGREPQRLAQSIILT